MLQGVDLVFYGDSILDGFNSETGGHTNVFKDVFGDYTALIQAIGGTSVCVCVCVCTTHFMHEGRVCVLGGSGGGGGGKGDSARRAANFASDCMLLCHQEAFPAGSYTALGYIALLYAACSVFA